MHLNRLFEIIRKYLSTSWDDSEIVGDKHACKIYTFYKVQIDVLLLLLLVPEKVILTFNLTTTLGYLYISTYKKREFCGAIMEPNVF